MKSCKHPTCEGVCRRPVKEKKLYTLPQRKKPLSKSLNSKVRSLASTDENKALVEADKVRKAELDLWFLQRKKELTGVCFNCGGKVMKDDPKYWKFSVCHVLPKALFKSVATHQENFIELCYFGNSCHTNFDNNGYEYVSEKMPKAWTEIVRKFKILYPFIQEKSKIPDLLLQELEVPL